MTTSIKVKGVTLDTATTETLIRMLMRICMDNGLVEALTTALKDCGIDYEVETTKTEE